MIPLLTVFKRKSSLQIHITRICKELFLLGLNGYTQSIYLKNLKHILITKICKELFLLGLNGYIQSIYLRNLKQKQSFTFCIFSLLISKSHLSIRLSPPASKTKNCLKSPSSISSSKNKYEPIHRYSLER